jgi:hypothetical protein
MRDMQVVLCACPEALSRKPWSLRLPAYTLKRFRSHRNGRIARRIAELQTRQSTESPSHEWLDSAQLPQSVKSVESLAGRAASSGFCLGSGPYRNCDWLATTEETPRPSLKHDHFVLEKFRFDGRWSIAIAIAIAIKYGMSSAAACIVAVSKRDPSMLRRTVDSLLAHTCVETYPNASISRHSYLYLYTRLRAHRHAYAFVDANRPSNAILYLAASGPATGAHLPF